MSHPRGTVGETESSKCPSCKAPRYHGLCVNRRCPLWFYGRTSNIGRLRVRYGLAAMGNMGQRFDPIAMARFINAGSSEAMEMRKGRTEFWRKTGDVAATGGQQY